MPKRKIDPRIADLFRRESPALQFVVLAVTSHMDKDDLDELLEQFKPRGVDMVEEVAGKPLHHWIGKTRSDLKRENLDAKQISEVEAAYEARGMSLDAGEEEPTKKKSTRKSTAASDAETSTAMGDESGGDENDTGDEGDEEKTFGGHPYSDLKGKTDEQLLAMEHIGPKTIEAIREHEKSLEK